MIVVTPTAIARCGVGAHSGCFETYTGTIGKPEEKVVRTGYQKPAPLQVADKIYHAE